MTMTMAMTMAMTITATTTRTIVITRQAPFFFSLIDTGTSYTNGETNTKKNQTKSARYTRARALV